MNDNEILTTNIQEFIKKIKQNIHEYIKKISDSLLPLIFDNDYAFDLENLNDIIRNELESFLSYLDTKDEQVISLQGANAVDKGLSERIIITLYQIFNSLISEDVLKEKQDLQKYVIDHILSYLSIFSSSFLAKKSSYIHQEQKQLYKTLTNTVTKQKEEIAEKERLLQESKIKALEEQSKKKTDFLVEVSHDIKLPLTIMQNTVNTLKEEAGRRKLPSLLKLEVEVEELKSMLIDILDYEKIQQGEMLYDHDKIVNISAITSEKVRLFHPLFNEKEIKVTTEIQNDLYTPIAPFALDRVLNNIIDNAVKYNSPGNGSIHITLTSSAQSIVLTIRDTGIGIPKRHLKYVFKPYFQSLIKKNDSHGVGVGLPIVKSIIKEIAGKIAIESEEKKGTVVTITFNKANIPESMREEIIHKTNLSKPLVHKTIHFKPEEYNEKKITVLVVENHKELLVYMQHQMDDFNFYFALDGREALHKLTTMPKPDIIISDIMMPHVDGYEFFEKLKSIKEFREIPFIFLTAKTAPDEKIKGLRSGAIDFIEKPFSIEFLKEKIKTLIRNRDLYNSKNVASLQNKITEILKAPEKSEYNYSLAVSSNFTAREREIIALLMKGMENREIADHLCISTETVKKHLQSMKEKCNVDNKIQLVNYFRI
ncbi:MAG: response regulator [Spirochaetales bacterium]|nr:response regulator [Spirochaetales bacterium]